MFWNGFQIEAFVLNLRGFLTLAVLNGGYRFWTVPDLFQSFPNIRCPPQAFICLPCIFIWQGNLNMFKISAYQTTPSYTLLLLWSCPSVALLWLARAINFWDSTLYHLYANVLCICTIFNTLVSVNVKSESFAHFFLTVVFNWPV